MALCRAAALLYVKLWLLTFPLKQKLIKRLNGKTLCQTIMTDFGL